MSDYKNLLIGITASADILKMPDYLANFSQLFPNIRIIVSENAQNLISTKVLNLFAEKVYKGVVEDLNTYNHINLSNWADVFIILPASANIIGKISSGIADDFLTTTVLAYGKDTIICPNMNSLMWENPIVEENVDYLKRKGYRFIGPEYTEAFEIATRKITKQYVVPSLDNLGKELKKILFD